MKRLIATLCVIYISIEQCLAEYILNPPEWITPDRIVQLNGKSAPIVFLWNLITYAIGIAGVLGVIGVTWWGIQMILSSGEDEKMKKARYILIYSLIGVLVAGLAYGVVDTVSRFRF